MDLKQAINVCKLLVNKLNKFKYGLPGKDGKIHHVKSSKEYDEKYRFLTPEEFEKYGGGICWDYVEYEVEWLNNHNVKSRKFYIFTETPPNWDTHTFVVVESNKKFIYVESSFERLRGVRVFDNLKDLITMIVFEMFECNNNKKHFSQFKYTVFEYTNKHPEFGCTSEEYMNWMSEHGKYIVDDVAKYKDKDAKVIKPEVEHMRFQMAFDESIFQETPNYRGSIHDTTYDEKETAKKLIDLHQKLIVVNKEARHMTRTDTIDYLASSYNTLAEIFDTIEWDYDEKPVKTSRYGFAKKPERKTKHRDEIDSLLFEVRDNIIELTKSWSTQGVRAVVDKMLTVYEYENEALNSRSPVGNRVLSNTVNKLSSKLMRNIMDASIPTVEDTLFTEAKLTAKDKKAMSNDMFGVLIKDDKGNIIERKYPLNDETHVLKAVQFFNKCPDKYKEELAKNIIRRAKALNMEWKNWDKINTYLKNKKRSKTLNEYYNFEFGISNDDDDDYHHADIIEEAVDINSLKKQCNDIFNQASLIKYGCLDGNGNRIVSSPFKDSWQMFAEYHSQSIQSIEQSKLGVCFEHSFYIAHLLENAGLPHQTFFMNIYIPNELDDMNEKMFWHQFTIVPNDTDSVVLIETALKPEMNGVFLVRDMEDAVQHLIDSFNLNLTEEENQSMKIDLIDVSSFNPTDGKTYLGYIDDVYSYGKHIKSEINVKKKLKLMQIYFKYLVKNDCLTDVGKKIADQVIMLGEDTEFDPTLLPLIPQLVNDKGKQINGSDIYKTIMDNTPTGLESDLDGYVQESYFQEIKPTIEPPPPPLTEKEKRIETIRDKLVWETRKLSYSEYSKLRDEFSKLTGYPRDAIINPLAQIMGSDIRKWQLSTFSGGKSPKRVNIPPGTHFFHNSPNPNLIVSMDHFYSDRMGHMFGQEYPEILYPYPRLYFYKDHIGGNSTGNAGEQVKAYDKNGMPIFDENLKKREPHCYMYISKPGDEFFRDPELPNKDTVFLKLTKPIKLIKIY